MHRGSDPLVAIVWLNYNSSKILNIALNSLKSIEDLDYENYLLFVLDNGSTDSSAERIVKFVKERPTLRKMTRILRLSHNLGFAGANNIAWRYIITKHPDTRYLVLVNNDAILYSDSLRKLVEIHESMPRTCGVQGIIEISDTGLIDSFGWYVDEMLTVYPFMWLRRIDEVPPKCFAVTYVSGAYAIYKVDILKSIALRNGDIFPSHAFAYFDDDILGVLAYINDFNMVSVPVRAARHFVSLTFKLSGVKEYFGLRAYVAKTMLYNTRLKPLAFLHAQKSVLRRAQLATIKDVKKARIIMRSSIDGIRLAKIIKNRYGLELSRDQLKKIPMIPINTLQSFLALASYRIVSKDVFKYLEIMITEKYGFRCI